MQLYPYCLAFDYSTVIIILFIFLSFLCWNKRCNALSAMKNQVANNLIIYGTVNDRDDGYCSMAHSHFLCFICTDQIVYSFHHADADVISFFLFFSYFIHMEKILTGHRTHDWLSFFSLFIYKIHEFIYTIHSSSVIILGFSNHFM